MAFTVYVSHDSSPSRSYGDNDVYKLPSSSGRLIVEPEDGETVVTYNHWTHLEADADHPAGGVKGKKSGGAAIFG